MAKGLLIVDIASRPPPICLPKIFVFEPEQLEETLDVAAHDFLDSFVDYNMNRATVRLPKVRFFLFFD